MSAFCALAFCLVASGAWGDSISIQNASFEQVAANNPLASPCNGPEFCAYNAGNPMPGWVVSGTNASAGQFEPSSSYLSLPLPDGSIVAYINSGSISQTLTGISLLPDSVYTLSVDVGRRFDVAAANYSLFLLDGANVFCTSGSNSNGTITAGTFTDITLTCATGATVPGGFLGIELTGDGRQINFDNVQLNVTTDTVATPEPSALALTLPGLFLGGLLFLRSRRLQYLPSASS
jgi:hypothetical protein